MNKIEFNPIGVLLCFFGLACISAVLFTVIGYIIALAGTEGFSLESIKNAESLQSIIQTKKGLTIIQVFSSIGVFLIPVWLTVRIFDGYSFKESLFISTPKPILVFIAGTLIFCGMLATTGWLHEINSLLPISDYWSIKEAQNLGLQKLLIQGDGIGSLIISILVVALLPALLEELAFRGLALSLFKKLYDNKHVAIILQGVIFGAIHMNMGQILPIMAIGILFGYIAYETKCIWYTVLIHFLNNALAVIALFYAEKTEWAKSLDTDAGLPIWQYAIGTTILAVGLYIFFTHHKKTSTTQLIDE